MSAAVTIFGTAILTLLLAGYFAQKYLPPPPPKLVAIDLGTTFSCIGIYHAVSGEVEILQDENGHKCIPSVVAFRKDKILVGFAAVAQADHNPKNTIFDAKRFIGKNFTAEEFEKERQRYPFALARNKEGMVSYVIETGEKSHFEVTPQDIGSHLLNTLKETAVKNLSVPVTRAVMSVPAEFNLQQREYTQKAATLSGLDIWRIINEPTAAALAYGLHKKTGIHNILVVDLGGGTLDVSLLYVQGGMFLTQAMAGNNHLGGQDFNQRLMNYLLNEIGKDLHQSLKDPEDLQVVREATEHIKIQLSKTQKATFNVTLNSIKTKSNNNKSVTYEHLVTRNIFEEINMDLFSKVLDPIKLVLNATDLQSSEIDDIVLVGGSTRIPKIRSLIRDFFGKDPNTKIDPELAVVTGVSIQAGIIGGAWPLQVSAIEVQTSVQKMHV